MAVWTIDSKALDLSSVSALQQFLPTADENMTIVDHIKKAAVAAEKAVADGAEAKDVPAPPKLGSFVVRFIVAFFMYIC